MKLSRILRWLVATLLTAQLLWMLFTAVECERFCINPSGFARGATIVALLVIFGGGTAAVLQSTLSSPVAWASLAAVIALTVRFHMPSFVSGDWSSPSTDKQEQRNFAAVAFLRRMSAAQEQWRIVHRGYASSVSELAVRLPDWREWSDLRIAVHGDRGWSAQLADDGLRCAIWVRDTTLRVDDLAEGSPRCNGAGWMPGHRDVRTFLGDMTEVPVSATAGLTGKWLQHRGDDAHGASTDSASSDELSWTARVDGELKAPVAIAGDQVFAGTHGNGELVSLDRHTGKIQWRVRVANWIHHEPVVVGDVVIVGFGNNESSMMDHTIGSAPSGVSAFDRRTGTELWTRLTPGSVMTTPVANDSIVVATTGGRESFAWRIRDGAQVWTKPTPGPDEMGNPLATDDAVIAGFEPTWLCAWSMATGVRRFCHHVDFHGWAAGHASVARADSLLLFQVLQYRDGSDDRFRWKRWLGRVMFRPEWLLMHETRPWIVAVDLATGREVWKTEVPTNDAIHVSGHVAGTPVIANGVAYVTIPTAARIAALDAATGQLRWATKLKSSRGSVFVFHDLVFSTTTDRRYVVLDAATGKQRCAAPLPAMSDRAGLTASGRTGFLTLVDGRVLARPLSAWLSCRV